MSIIEAQAQAAERQDEISDAFLVDSILPRAGLVALIGTDPYRLAVAEGFGYQIDDTAVDRTFGGREILARPALLAVGEGSKWLGNPPDVGRLTMLSVTARSFYEAAKFASFAKTAGVGLIVSDGVAGLRGVGSERAAELSGLERVACIAVAREVAKATPCCVMVATTPGGDADRLARLAHTVIRVEGAGHEGKITVSRDGEFVAWFGCTFDGPDEDSECITLGNVWELPAQEAAA